MIYTSYSLLNNSCQKFITRLSTHFMVKISLTNLKTCGRPTATKDSVLQPGNLCIIT